MIYKIGKRRVKKSVYLRHCSRAKKEKQVEFEMNVYKKGENYYLTLNEFTVKMYTSF